MPEVWSVIAHDAPMVRGGQGIGRGMKKVTTVGWGSSTGND